MARNRQTQDREEKRDEIIDAARRLFSADGYDATSIGKLATSAGIATNTIYWYFDDKDAVLIEVLQRVMREAAEEYQAAPPATLADQLMWLVGVFDRISTLTVTIHARAQVSEPVRVWHERFHARGDAWLLAQAEHHLAERPGGRVPSTQELAAVPRIWSYAIEGMVAHGLGDAERRDLCRVLVKQLEAL